MDLGQYVSQILGYVQSMVRTPSTPQLVVNLPAYIPEATGVTTVTYLEYNLGASSRLVEQLRRCESTTFVV